MQKKTEAVLTTLGSLNWFKSVGIASERNAIQLSSWEEAFQACANTDWDDFQLDRASDIGISLRRSDPDRYESWNEIVEQIKPACEQLLERPLRHLSSSLKWPEVFYNSLRWDILHVCLEAEFSDLVPPAFYLNVVLPCYSIGHFPCGWKGPFPEGGRLVIY